MATRQEFAKRAGTRVISRAPAAPLLRAFVLSGGTARASYHVGTLDYLIRTKKLDSQNLRGVSVGALNSAFLAQASVGTSPAESLANLQAQTKALLDLWSTEITGNSDIFRARPGGFTGLALGADSLNSVEGLKRIMDAHLDEGKLAASGWGSNVGCAPLVSGLYDEKGPDTPSSREMVLASSAIPVIFLFVRRETAGEPKDVLVDSAVRNITPLRSAFGADPPAEEIWVLLTRRVDPKPNGDLPDSATKPETLDQWDDNFLGTKVSGIDVLKRAVEPLTDEIYLGDLDTAIEWNTLLGPVEKLIAAAKGRQLPPPLRSAVDDPRRAAGVVGKRAVKLYVIAPRECYGQQPNHEDRDSSPITFSPAAIARGIAHGRKVATNRFVWIRT